MNNLNRLLQEIKNNPVMYLDKPSITHLHSFLSGYLNTQYMELFISFQKWIQETEKTSISPSWDKIILFVCGSERNAFYSFFELFEKFLKQKDDSIIQESEEKYSAPEDNSSFLQFDIYNEILSGVKKRPGMYLGSSSITKLDMSLRGTSLARREAGVPPTAQEREFEGFQSWIQEKYAIKTGQSWSKIILFYSVDEYEALYKFFELFEEYLNSNKSLDIDENTSKC
ncbi:hypothetical protein LC593_19870 [Nostoc sp. CHAB 5844]|nr:hypothetical protein [Nostoc sp. CHAB 5844]